MKVFCALVFTLLYFHVNGLVNPIVHTSLGDLKGIEDETVLGKRIYAFLGVPYAKPPIGKHRFEEPQPVDRWQGTWAATEVSAVCLQHLLNYDLPESILGEEDCLYLNIYTPNTLNHPPLPVLVYFHGGAFMYGSGNMFSPHFIFDLADFVFVSVNYRLGPLGFLSTEDGVVPGNNGLKDQVLALKWIQSHIGAFGGNKDDVTIAGLSAGGASVQLHYLSPMSRGLFNKGISLSGSALCPWVLAESSAEKTKMLASSVGCTTKNSKVMIECLKERPGRKILAKLSSLFWPWLDLPFSPFGVVVESPNDKAFLSEHPIKLLSERKVSDLPWIASITSEEGLYPAAAFVDREPLLQELNRNWNQIAPHLLDYNYTILPQNQNEVSEKIRKFYLGDGEISLETRDKVVELTGDRLFNVDIERAARYQAAATKSPVYFYKFAYQGKYSISQFFTKSNATLGVSHGDDLTYLLTRPIFSPLETDDDKAVMLRMTKIWTSFIETGVPSPGTDVQWDATRHDTNDNNYLNFLLINSHKDIQQVTSRDLANREFWDSLKFNEHQWQDNLLYQSKDEL